MCSWDLSRTPCPSSVAVASRYKAFGYLDEANNALRLSAADVVVGRAGSGTIFEAAAFGKPMILIPIPREIAGAQQEENAYAAREAGFAKVIEEENLSPGIFLSELRSILEHPEVSTAMSESAAKFYNPKSAELIAGEIMALVH